MSSDREQMIEKAAKAIDPEAFEMPDDLPFACEEARGMARVALAVFEEAHAPSPDEREALAIARNIVNQIGDVYHERIPSPDWVQVRQETNDELDAFTARLIAGFHRTAQDAPSTDERRDDFDAANVAFRSRAESATWGDPADRDAAVRWHWRGFQDGASHHRALSRADTEHGQGEPSDALRERVQQLVDAQQSWIDAGRSVQAISRDAVRDSLQRVLDETRDAVTPQGDQADAGVGWFEWFKMPENTTEIAYVHENGEVFDPARGWDPPEFVIAAAEGRAFRLVRAAGVVAEQGGENRG